MLLALVFAAITQGPTVTASNRQVTITWKTDVPGSSEVEWGYDADGGYAFNVVEAVSNTSHSVTLTDPPPAQYFFRVRSGASRSNEGTFTIPSPGPGTPINRLTLGGEGSATAVAAGAVYVGGEFSSLAPLSGSGIFVDRATGARLPGRPWFSGGTVYYAVPDGAGGLYVAGGFTEVGGLPRRGLAHLLPGGGVDPDFDVAVQGPVWIMELVGNTLFLGGAFSGVDGLTRNYAAAIDVPSRAVLAWAPNPNGTVYALKAVPGTVYLGGEFSTVRGAAHPYAAAVDANAGMPTTWNPVVNGPVYSIEVVGTRTFIGGNFTAPRQGLAVVDANSGATDPLNLMLMGRVNMVRLIGADMYIGGEFGAPGGASRLARFDPGTGVVSTWLPAVPGEVSDFALDGNTLYLTGARELGGAAVDATTGALLPWRANVADFSWVVRPTPAGIFVGGDFAGAGGVARGFLAALAPETLELLPFDGAFDSSLFVLRLEGNTLYSGGKFLTAGGMQRSRLAAHDITTGALLPWAPTANDSVYAINIANGAVYVGGDFTQVSGTARTRIARLDVATAALQPWNPGANGRVWVFHLEGQGVVVSGDFTTLGGAGRPYLGMVDVTSGMVSGWNPNANGAVYTLLPRPGGLAVGGDFDTIEGASRRGFAELVVATGTATATNFRFDSSVYTVTSAGRELVAAGTFSNVGGVPRVGGAHLAEDGGVLPYSPGIFGGSAEWVDADCATGLVHVTGSFFSAGGVPTRGLTSHQVNLACDGGTAPSVVDNQLGDVLWRRSSGAVFDVDFADAEGLRRFDVRMFSSPFGEGTRLTGWVAAGDLTGTFAGADWPLPPTVFAMLPEGQSWAWVRAVDAAGNVAVLRDAFFVRKDVTAPDAVLGLQIVPAGPPLTLEWTASSDAVSGVAFYRLYRDGALRGDALSALQYNEPPIAPNESHVFEARAVDWAGNESAGNATLTVSVSGDGGLQTDAGTAPVDGGMSGTDGGTTATPGVYRVSCGCSAADALGLAAFALLSKLLRRRVRTAWGACR